MFSVCLGRKTPLNIILRTCAGSFALVFAYSCGYNLLLLTAPLYLLQIYDRVLSSRSTDTLVMLTLIVIVTVVVGGLLDALRRIALGRIGTWLDGRLQPLVLWTSLRSAVEGGPSRPADACRDISALVQFLHSSACPTLFDVLWAPLFLCLLFLVHPLLGTLGILGAVVTIASTAIGERWTDEPLARSGAAFARSQARLGAVVANRDAIRAMGMLRGAARLAYEDALASRGDHQEAQHRNGAVLLFTKPFKAVLQILVMGAAAWLVLHQDRSPAIIFVASLLFGRGLAPIEGATAGWKAFTAAVAAAGRINNILLSHRPIDSSQAGRAEIAAAPLVLNNVAFTPSGANRPLVKGVSFRIEPGECLGIIGLSGSGKSTLGRMIVGLNAPTEGTVRLGDADVSELCRSQGRQLGYLPQETDLVGGTIREIIARLQDANLDQVIEAAELAGLHETIMRLPAAYDTDVANGGLILLRGHRQRLGLARALFGKPRLVVLDEPNASLDYIGERILFDAIERMKAVNTTVVIITHRVGILSATDRIAIMNTGGVSAFGSREEIFRSHLEAPRANPPARLSGESQSLGSTPSNHAQPLIGDTRPRSRTTSSKRPRRGKGPTP
jgi:ATP-binding cassette subfamily C protein